MDDPLVIFDSGDEMVFSPEPSNIHFQIHRLSDAGGMTVSEDHYSILNELFGTPVSPDPVEDTFTSILSTPKMTLSEFLEDLTMEVDNNGEVTVNTNVKEREELGEREEEAEIFLPEFLENPITPSRPTQLSEELGTQLSEELGSKNVEEHGEHGVTEYDLSNFFTKSKNAFKSETKKKLGKKKVISRCISTHQSPRINKFVSKIKSNTPRHLTIKKFAEDHFSVFTENIFYKLDNLTTEIAVCHQNIKKLQESLDEFKLLKCKCKRRSNRHLLEL